VLAQVKSIICSERWNGNMDDLFSLKCNFRVVRISEADVHVGSDHLKRLRELVLENDPMYPNIEEWFDEKVMVGLRASERIGYVGYLDEKPAVSAIVKREEAAKFCHLRIKEELQDIHLGEAFFALMGLEVRGFAKEVHFTLPESLWEMENKFFKSFGFAKAVKAGHQYRLFDDELRCSAPFNIVWKAIREKLPKITRMFSINGNSLDNKVLMSIKAEHAEKVLSGEKKVEIRRKFSKRWTGSKVSIYASRPESSLVGEALISKIVVDKPENVWERFHDQIGCTKEEFNNYTRSLSEIYAIVLENATPYTKSMSICEVSNLTNKKLRPPQNYYNLNNNTNWAEAVSIGALLQGSFRIHEPIML
jgi:predicted transcriptional regulator